MSDGKYLDLLPSKKFDIEHAINMYALSFFYMPANGIYNQEILSTYDELIANCHIYMIGFVPRVTFVNAEQRGRDLYLTYEILGESYDLVCKIPPEASLKREDDFWFLEDGTGKRFFPGEVACLQRLNRQYGVIKFLVKYIGQAYGRKGDRSAWDRLIKHETLQKISILGAPEGYRLELLLLQVEPNNQIITMFNPFAENREDSSARIDQGLEKLFNTSEEERVALYEAAMIRYFSPEFNKEFKNSFPSTTLKILQDCYDKDFSAVCAELVLGDLPCTLYSESVKPTDKHFAFYDLHTDEARKVFFAI